MNNSVIKDPAFPMRHAQVTEYLVDLGHQGALISAWNELRMKEN